MSQEHSKLGPDEQPQVPKAVRSHLLAALEQEFHAAMAEDSFSSNNLTQSFARGDLPESRKVGRYRLDVLLGEGSFGRVWLGYDEELGRKVAIKVPTPERFKQAADADAYVNEARTLARLDHPNVVPIYDVGRSEDGSVYIVSKYVDGRDLAQIIEQGDEVSTASSVTWLLNVAQGLHHAHQKGLIHRDVKPGNILVDSKSAAAFVTDFGLAVGENDFPEIYNLAGTPAYMSPEQARGENHRLDARSDVFALGVIMYELLTGQRPFRGSTPNEIFDQIIRSDPIPPSELADDLPQELERICLKALAKQSSQRFDSAAAFAEDLSSWKHEPSTIPQDLRIIPKGLRAFDADDSDFFLRLLPGPFTREGLPESIRFWKSSIEERDAENTFNVGLLYGPSGCGKSSLVKAGLIPRLSTDVVAIYVEANGHDTEKRIVRRIHKAIAETSDDCSLVQLFANIRRKFEKKVVFIIDQFEQWLHANRAESNTELLGALRQCDGGNLQSLLMVRDDFGMAASRFMRDLDCRIVEGRNFGTVDLFDIDHAAHVLTEFGRAYGKLPKRHHEISDDQRKFINLAASGLSQDGKVVSVQLALFAEMIKSKPWHPKTLKIVGGTRGVGVSFLEETFDGRDANPEYRFHAAAARCVLQALLPEVGTDIKGHMRSHAELLNASRYQESNGDFLELLRILDGELRLITPTDPSGADSASGSAPTVKFYQLTHDYLVPALRDWLLEKQRETPQGRAELLLAERTSAWHVKPERRNLPSWREYNNIRNLVDVEHWSEPQRSMMNQAAVHHAKTLVARLLKAKIEDLPSLIEQLESVRNEADVLLRMENDKAEEGSRAKLYTSLALLTVDDSQVDYILDQLLAAVPEEFQIICDRVHHRADKVIAKLWSKLEDASEEEVLRIASALAAFEPDGARWRQVAKRIATTFTSVDPQQFGIWKEALRPIRAHLMPTLVDTFRNHEVGELELTLATSALADYCQEDTEFLCDLVCDATPKQFEQLLPILQNRRQEVVEFMEREIGRCPEAAWEADVRQGEGAQPIPFVWQQIEENYGTISDEFAFCASIPSSQLDDLLSEMSACGYQPLQVRTYLVDGCHRAAVVWMRGNTAWQYRIHQRAEEILEIDAESQRQGFRCIDLSSTVTRDQHVVYDATWHFAGQTPYETKLVMEQPPHEADEQIQLLEDAGYNIRRITFAPSTGVSPQFSCLCDKRTDIPFSYRAATGDLERFEADIFPGLLLTDVRLYKSCEGEHESGWEFAAIWQISTTHESQAVMAESPDDLVKGVQRLAGENYRPQSISVGVGGGSAVWACIASRPIVADVDKERLGKRKANAAVALLRLERDATVWGVLKHSPDPRSRSHLIHRFRPYRVPVDVLIQRLAAERDVSVRRALIQAIGDASETTVSKDDQDRFIQNLQYMYKHDADAGIHASIRWLLSRWLSPDENRRLDSELSPADYSSDKGWFINSQAQTFSIVNGPVAFVMGSPPTETGREGGPYGNFETPHHRLIDYSFAVQSTLVTINEFLRFRPDFTYRQIYAPDERCPINQVTFYDAAAYCNWLSCQEGIPEDQWAYYPNENGEYAEGMVIPGDFLSKAGYRLPLESEYEYVCRAGARTSRFYGETGELDEHYSWVAKTSHCRSAIPVGTLKPNDLGLFDVLGNVMQWCHLQSYKEPFAVNRLSDVQNCKRVKDTDKVAGRGAHFCVPEPSTRSAYLSRFAPNFHLFAVGFRLSKTINLPVGGAGEQEIVTNTTGFPWRGANFIHHSNQVRSSYRPDYRANIFTFGNGFRLARTVAQPDTSRQEE